jgi:hypothetical protein
MIDLLLVTAGPGLSEQNLKKNSKRTILGGFFMIFFSKL